MRLQYRTLARFWRSGLLDGDAEHAGAKAGEGELADDARRGERDPLLTEDAASEPLPPLLGEPLRERERP